VSALRPDAAELRSWSEELAHDPRSPVFLALARRYAECGRHDAALRLCVHGLRHHPEHVGAHVLLGRLFRDAGEIEKAFDEWEIALHLDPGHEEARREIALLPRPFGAGTVTPELGGRPRPPTHHDPSGVPIPAAPTREQSLQAPIDRLADAVRPQSLLLLSSSGRMLAQRGFSRDTDVVGMASLGAGIHAASRAIATMIGEPGFEQVCQSGAGRQLFLGTVATPAEELILLVVTRDPSSLGLLRVAFRALVREVASIPAAHLGKRSVCAETFEQDLEAGWTEMFGGNRSGIPRVAPARASERSLSPL